MIPAAFDYQRAGLARRRARGARRRGDAKVIAGGMSLLPLMKLRLAQPGPARRHRPARPSCKGVRAARRRRLRDRRADDLRRVVDRRPRRSGSRATALADIGDIQVRNRGTVGGAIAHADPASDLPALAARAR